MWDADDAGGRSTSHAIEACHQAASEELGHERANAATGPRLLQSVETAYELVRWNKSEPTLRAGKVTERIEMTNELGWSHKSAHRSKRDHELGWPGHTAPFSRASAAGKDL
jgi:hypothetical protein